jgi:hypothetical protein
MPSKVFDTRKGRHIWPLRTICEVHRELYDLLALEKYDQILPLLEEAYELGIKMTKKLVEYKLSLPEWKDNNNKEAQRLRKLRIELEAGNSLRS